MLKQLNNATREIAIYDSFFYFRFSGLYCRPAQAPGRVVYKLSATFSRCLMIYDLPIAMRTFIRTDMIRFIVRFICVQTETFKHCQTSPFETIQHAKSNNKSLNAPPQRMEKLDIVWKHLALSSSSTHFLHFFCSS